MNVKNKPRKNYTSNYYWSIFSSSESSTELGMPVTPATQEDEERGRQLQGRPAELTKTLSQTKGSGWGCGSVVEYLHGKQEALVPLPAPSPHQENKKPKPILSRTNIFLEKGPEVLPSIISFSGSTDETAVEFHTCLVCCAVYT